MKKVARITVSAALAWIRLGACLSAASWLAPTTAAAELKPAAAQAFDRYVQEAERRMQKDLAPGGAFLWVNSLSSARRDTLLARLHRGEVVTQRLANLQGAEQEPSDKAYPASAVLPGALIHHWLGTIFIPGASLPQVLALLQDYDHHKIYYAPQVLESKMLSRSGGAFEVYYRLARTKIVTIVLDTNYDVHYEQLDSTRALSRSYSTRIAEVESAGKPSERESPPGEDHGFLWRLDTFWRFAQADGGVYVQCEAISLTRDIPLGLNWLIAPFVESVPQESLEFTLQSTRAAVLHQLSQGSKPDKSSGSPN